jgi:hypothetical protein
MLRNASIRITNYQWYKYQRLVQPFELLNGRSFTVVKQTRSGVSLCILTSTSDLRFFLHLHLNMYK